MCPSTHRLAELTIHHGYLAQHSAEEPDNLRATTGTVEVPTIKDNDAALALGDRHIQQHELAARHTTSSCFSNAFKYKCILTRKNNKRN